MATARQALLDAALTALARRPWSGVRMVDVAAAARVSRQTLYNEFGSKDGLARALVRREADGYLTGVERALAGRPAGVDDRLVAVAEWTVGAARANSLVRALLTGCWGEWLPGPGPARYVLGTAVSPVPAQRRADAGSPGAAELVAAVRERSLAALGTGRTKEEAAVVAYRCELAVRLALSYVVAPAASGDDFARILRTALGGAAGGTAGGGGPGLSGPSPRAGGR
ncbi:TetR family transcriptional regulator [Streptomyces agglomeratus]|uniref:TetR family transcriptional regulator n=1 Tax=Streptomyces agglomeratus TaxID=285458 RepID=A0A1E5P6C6_9ACTN|nr:TetR/AcrR family transcriptional regulator [Streptomyces agglomeratus]OEJ25108.1 TetR family transcriptional regulator [Streptomyces agglomeratus]OEJ40864.1 TetR family transcriptional regulator [Streptomyces agglomeratus]OEJ44756.1 TetR family transcriptional regulator [Streptomyces agglomeratus]OEJ53403.1 TetR family transcriptional regulator [Streptomyces agglomeratus]OEJ60741.1 TetR family transcriptional regulator [Streptomyces agglomeratus]